MEHEVNVLRKLLNHKIFLDRFPVIKSVDVRKYGKGIDVVFFLKDDYVYDDYSNIKSDAYNLVYDLTKMAGLSIPLINVYP